MRTAIKISYYGEPEEGFNVSEFKDRFHVFNYKKQELTNEFYYTEELYLEKLKAE